MPIPVEYLKNITIVLVKPVGAGNIGSSARAMKNMGFSKLSLVSPVNFHNDAAYEMACKAKDLLYNAEVFDSLEDALKKSTFVIGASRRSGKHRPEYMNFDQGIKSALTAVKNNNVHIVFGTEKDGLSNEELKLCQHKISIPTNPDFGSLNLSQAVLIICHEIRKAMDLPEEVKDFSPMYPSSEELEFMYKKLEIVLSEIGYYNRKNNELINNISQGFRRIFSRSNLERRDYKMIMGFCSKIDEYNTEK